MNYGHLQLSLRTSGLSSILRSLCHLLALSHTFTARMARKTKSTTPQLSCELCRDRKVKCDKLDPCSNCASAGAVCVPVQRLRRSRGRHVQRPTSYPLSPKASPEPCPAVNVDPSFDHRIRRLEELVNHMNPGTINNSLTVSEVDPMAQRLWGIVSVLTSSPSQTTPGTGLDRVFPSHTRNLNPTPQSDDFWFDVRKEVWREMTRT